MSHMKIKIIFLFLIFFSSFSFAKDLDYTWTNSHPILTNYIKKNSEKILNNGKYLFNNKEHYIDFIEQIAEENDVPKEIAIVAGIESSFNPKAISNAGAIGMWQFMEETAFDMGLSSDERKDWKKSTEAAIKYLKWLSYKFNGDYELALLAYNGGIGRVEKAIKKHNTIDPWILIEKKALPKETMEYLPKFITYVYYYNYINKNK